ncbi:zinc finger protein 62-like [Maniola jurtina]|uniref:zinc finger protein 62-like n=1 Tax=Maniola jurtina TaxID=191418 RepID=UPI001E68F72D|nr:zinc finger protein 62-like [Maniola jurtina]
MTLAERKNAAYLLEYTTVTPFTYLLYPSSFKCLFCEDKFMELQTVLEHSRKHEVPEHDQILKDILKKGKKRIKVDISSLECRICKESLVSLANAVCDSCGKGFLSYQRLITHMESHKNGTYPCEKCKKTFPSVSKLKYHNDKTHSKVGKAKLAKCHKCLERFEHHYEKINHLKEIHGVSFTYACETCNLMFKTRHSLSMHVIKYHTQNIICEICRKTFSERCHLRKHMAIHTLERNYVCPILSDQVLRVIFHLLGKTEKDWSKIAERRGPGPILRENSLKLIENSTMFVFQYNKSWYSCYCCKETFPDMIQLRDHTENAHNLQDIEKRIISQQNKLLKVEISFLKCKICDQNLTTLPEFRQHLQDTHTMEFGHGQDLLMPYKLQTEGLKCQICTESFYNFRLLNMHMNKLHFQNHICDVCGASFANLVFLNLHKTRSHRKIRCEVCNLSFVSRSDKKDHDMNEHNVQFVRRQRFPCPYCNERFFQENFKMVHLVEKHGMVKPEHKCSLCAKVFITKALLNNHVKNVHKKERKHECDVCQNVFYTRSDLLRHRVTHTGEKKFSCALCNCPFATKDSLRRHMKRNACRS